MLDNGKRNNAKRKKQEKALQKSENSEGKSGAKLVANKEKNSRGRTSSNDARQRRF